MDLEEEGVGGVKAVEVDAFNEDDGADEAGVGRVGVAFVGDGEGEIERAGEGGDVPVHCA